MYNPAEPLILTIPGRAESISDGMRLSTGCPCRRLREYRDKTLYSAFPLELDTRGFLNELALRVAYFHDCDEVYQQVVVPWEYGESHLDFFIAQGPEEKLGVREAKCNWDGMPDDANVEQVQRQIFVVERAVARGVTEFVAMKGVWPNEVEVRIPAAQLLEHAWKMIVMQPEAPIVLSPNGQTVRLHDARRAQLEAEWELQAKAMTHIDKLDLYWPDDWPECTCGKCWIPPEFELNLDGQGAAARYIEAMENEKDGKTEKDIAGDELRELMERMAVASGDEEFRRRLVGGGFKVTRGVDVEYEKIAYKQAFEALGPDATLDDIRAGGFSTQAKRRGAMRVTRQTAKELGMGR